ncbi:MAG: hypothetical protein JO340_16920 [Acidobacteriaceae bacterium]|nr:hypothetical protein [Acidobacteriaceae bacterium]
MQPNYRFQLLAPPDTPSGGAFGRPNINKQLYDHYLSSIQKLRGRIYLKDGAIRESELDDEGRFFIPGDKRSWHFLLVDSSQSVIGGARYLVHSRNATFDQLRVRHSALANNPNWAPKVRAAVEQDLQTARLNKFSYVEIGGWALSEEWRGTRAALEILVASYALAHLWGGCLGACAATARHGSSSILRRIGGSSFEVGGEVLPPYEDPQYGCQMELLRFDCRTPSPRFTPLIAQLRSKLAGLPILRPAHKTAWDAAPAWSTSPVYQMA